MSKGSEQEVQMRIMCEIICNTIRICAPVIAALYENSIWALADKIIDKITRTETITRFLTPRDAYGIKKKMRLLEIKNYKKFYKVA
jgi:hypothetical protein